MDQLNHGSRSRLPQAPWVLYFDGASRKPAGHGGLGAILKNSKGQVVEEERRFLGGGISSGLAKYKALLAGLKKAKSLQVKHLLVKGNSRLLINQVVGRWTVRDSHLREHLKKVWAISKEFDCLFMEFIPKDQNDHTDRMANAAIDKELQSQVNVVTELYSSAWPKVIKEPARIPKPFSNLKLRPVSPPRASKPLSVMFRGDGVQTSDSDLTRTIQSLSSRKADRFWHRDPDRLSISDESSTSTASCGHEEKEEEEGHVNPYLSERIPGPAPVAVVVAAEDESGEDDADEDEPLQEFCPPAPACAPPGSAAHSTVQLSEADCDRLVSAVLERLKKKNKFGTLDD